MLNAAARKADHIITVSNYSKAQIMETLGTPGSKISVIHCGVGAQFRQVGGQRESSAAAGILGIKGPFLLYVGNLKPHKNVPTLLRAFAELRRGKKLAHSLLIVGEDAKWKRSVVEECSRLGIGDSTVFAPYVSPELLPHIYAAADLLVMPPQWRGSACLFSSPWRAELPLYVLSPPAFQKSLEMPLYILIQLATKILPHKSSAC